LGWPLARDGVVYFTVKDGAVGLDCRTGFELWRYQITPVRDEVRDPATTMPPMLVGNAIILAYRNGLTDVVKLPSTPTASAAPAQAVAIHLTPLVATGAVVISLMAVGFILRRPRAMISLLFLLALVATLLAWSRSYSSSEFVGAKRFARSGNYLSEATSGVRSDDGALVLGTKQTVWERTIKRVAMGDSTCRLWWTRSPPPILPNGLRLDEPARDLGLRHFVWMHRSRTSGTPLGEQAETSLTLPHWFAAVIFALPPFAWLTDFWRDRRRHPTGHCTHSGYDLRASTDRSPECGTAVHRANPEISAPS
jgi:hypothetical protein